MGRGKWLSLTASGCVLWEIPFDKLSAGSRPAGGDAGLRDDAENEILQPAPPLA